MKDAGGGRRDRRSTTSSEWATSELNSQTCNKESRKLGIYRVLRSPAGRPHLHSARIPLSQPRAPSQLPFVKILDIHMLFFFFCHPGVALNRQAILPVVQFNTHANKQPQHVQRNQSHVKSLYITGDKENKHAAFITQTIPVHTAHTELATISSSSSVTTVSHSLREQSK